MTARTFDGDSTMTSLVPCPFPAAALAFLAPPLLAFAAVLAAFVFAVGVLAGTLFPSSHSRCDRLTVPRGHAPPCSCNHRPVWGCSLGFARISRRFCLDP